MFYRNYFISVNFSFCFVCVTLTQKLSFTEAKKSAQKKLTLSNDLEVNTKIGDGRVDIDESTFIRMEIKLDDQHIARFCSSNRGDVAPFP